MIQMKKPLRIVLGGATGRMGRQIASLAAQDPRFSVVGGVGLEKTPPPGDFPYGPSRSLPLFLKSADVLIDFSLPAGSLEFLKAAAKAKIPSVVGTTGYSPKQAAALKSFAKRIPILYAPNMSPGMNLLWHLAAVAAKALPGYDAGIFEFHHAKKLDAPSGSALRLGEAFGSGREGSGKVPTVALRAGGIIGDHTLLLAGPDERIELKHQAQSRAVFARGALDAAAWLKPRRPGLYSMKDLLGL